MSSHWKIPEMWKGQRCWIIGGGLSIAQQFDIPDEVVSSVIKGQSTVEAYSPYLEPLHNEKVIGINNAYKLGNWIDLLFFGDCSWYLQHRFKLISWPGLKVTKCSRFANNRNKRKNERIKYVGTCRDQTGYHGISRKQGYVKWNGNSGAAGISIAHQLGVKQIILLGFDMCNTPVKDAAKRNFSHWHGSHHVPGEQPPRNPPYARHLGGFQQIAKDAQELGLEILNASPKSAIKHIQKTTVKELLK